MASTAAPVEETTTTENNGVLTAATLPAYLLEHQAEAIQTVLCDHGGDAATTLTPTDLTVTPILGGNVNYAFCVTAHGKSLFCKQAPEYVAIFGPDGFPLTSERMQRELDVYEEWRQVLVGGAKIPTIYFFDPQRMVVGMEFLDGYALLDHVLVDATMNSRLVSGCAVPLGSFLGQTHAATHASKVTAERKAYLTTHFENRPMRDIQLEFVFSKCYNEATDEQRVGLNVTPEFLAEIQVLKQHYNGQDTDNLVLCHGDLHPGSVMVHPNNDAASPSDVHIIDPEFTVYGPPGLDVGSLLSGYCLGALHQAYAGNVAAAHTIRTSMAELWESYTIALAAGYRESKEDAKLDDSNKEMLVTKILRTTEIETVGYTLAEVCRTALEFAGGRKWLQFEDQPETQRAAKRAALELVDATMVARHTGGMALLDDKLKQAVDTAAARTSQ